MDTVVLIQVKFGMAKCQISSGFLKLIAL